MARLATVAQQAIAAGDSQNFLAARWVPWLLARAKHKSKTALRLLSLSPHYFCLGEATAWPSQAMLEAESDRNRDSRRHLANELVSRFITPTDIALDYGCGAGYLAAAMADKVAGVIACDISRGVIRCAEVINPHPNVEYFEIGSLDAVPDSSADVAYCFAVAQHLTDQSLKQALATISRLLRPGGTLLLHVVIDAEGWQTEESFSADHSAKQRLKSKFGLHCFSRTVPQILSIMSKAGFAGCRIEEISNYTKIEDDIARQHLVIARKG